MYSSFPFFCHLCLLYFTVRVEQSAIHARGCCFCHPSTFQNPGPQSAKWTHPKKFLLNKSPMEVHPDISAEPMNSVNFRVKLQLSTAFLPFPLPFGLSGSTQAFAGPIWAASLSLVKKTNPHAHFIVLIFSFSFSLMKIHEAFSYSYEHLIRFDPICIISSPSLSYLIQRFHRKSRHHWPSHDGFTSTAAKVCIHRHKDTTWLTSNVAQHGTALEVFHRNNTARPSSKPASSEEWPAWHKEIREKTQRFEQSNESNIKLCSQTLTKIMPGCQCDQPSEHQISKQLLLWMLVQESNSASLLQKPKKFKAVKVGLLTSPAIPIRCAADQTKSTPSLLAQPGCVIWYCWWSWYQLDSGCHKQDLSRILDENSI